MKSPLNVDNMIAFRLASLSLIALMAISLGGCWRKKCCKTVEETVQVQRMIEVTPCENCEDITITELGLEGTDDEFPAVAEPNNGGHTKERRSGPSGWAGLK